VNTWLAGAEHRQVVLAHRRGPGHPLIVPTSLVHAIREDLDTTACGIARPAYCIGFWPTVDADHCPSCAAVVNVATDFSRQSHRTGSYES
jgi:hypothetical protein